MPAIATEEYGRRLITDTAQLLGPDHDDPTMRYSGSRLACASCHLGSGADPGMLSLLESADLYPRYSGRDGGERDLFDRINGCMERSMNGRALPRNSPEMIAMVNYVESLGDRFKAMGTSLRKATDPPAFVRPERAVDFTAGEQVFKERCTICHGTDGLGLRASANAEDGYVFPPLWGPDSFNDGAGMARVLTAARFIKARMPLGEPTLTDDEAFDVAGYHQRAAAAAHGESGAGLSEARRQADRQPVRSICRPVPAGPAQVRAVQADRGLLQGAEERASVGVSTLCNS